MFSSTYNQRETVCVSSYRLVSWFIPFDFVDWSQEERKMTAFSLSVIGLCRHKPAVIELFPSSPPPHIFGCTPFQLGSRAAGGGRVLGKRKTPVVGDLSIDSVVVFVVVVVVGEVVVLDTTPPLETGDSTDGRRARDVHCVPSLVGDEQHEPGLQQPCHCPLTRRRSRAGIRPVGGPVHF